MTDFDEYIRSTGILTNWTATGSRHARVHQNLRHRILGTLAFLSLPCGSHRLNEIWRMVIRDVLKGFCDRIQQVVFADNVHNASNPMRSVPKQFKDFT